MAEYVVLDFETANPKRVSACSVGGCVIADGAIVDKFSIFLMRVFVRRVFALKNWTPTLEIDTSRM